MLPKKAQNKKPSDSRFPLFSGAFVGQCTYFETLTPTGKVIGFEDKKTGEYRRFKIKELRGTVHYVWNGMQWVSPEVFDTQYNPRKPGIIRCKNLYNGEGFRRKY